MKTDSILKLILSIALPLVVGAVSGILTAKAIPEWYSKLNQPTFNPPDWLFGPVWTVLYIVMGISLYLVWIQPPGQIRTFALAAFFIQLLLNFGWSILFFYFKSIGLALGEIIFLWLSIFVTLVLFYKIKPLATYINIPYLLWVSFATILNASYFKLN